MFYSAVVVVVLAAWKLVRFVDTYSGGRIAKRLGLAAVLVLGAVSWIAPKAFAEGTTRFVAAENAHWNAWIQVHLRDVFNVFPPTTPPKLPSTTTTTSTTTTG